MDVAGGRENGCHCEGRDADGEEEGGELHCCGLSGGLVGWFCCVVKRIEMGIWEGKELLGGSTAGTLNGVGRKDC